MSFSTSGESTSCGESASSGESTNSGESTSSRESTRVTRVEAKVRSCQGGASDQMFFFMIATVLGVCRPDLRMAPLRSQSARIHDFLEVSTSEMAPITAKRPSDDSPTTQLASIWTWRWSGYTIGKSGVAKRTQSNYRAAALHLAKVWMIVLGARVLLGSDDGVLGI